jgi:hypothetical protein
LQVDELAPGLWSWTARHPEWRAGFGWSEEVRCFYVETDDATLLLDPLVPADERERFWAALDRDVERRGRPVAVLLTQAAHARSAGELAVRYAAAVWAHEGAADKVGDTAFRAISHGDELPGNARVLAFEQEEGGSGTPLYLPSHRAVAVGDVFIAVDGDLRVWWSSDDADSERWYRTRYVPSLRAWLDLPIERVLVAHGEQVAGGSEEIAAALVRPPYQHL